MASVSLTGVSKVYPGGVKAVDRVSLAIEDRQFVVLVGPSGCGKSTTLRMVAGLEEMTSGTIRIGDRVVNKESPKDRDVAMVFQNYALYPHMSVYRNMAFSLNLRRRALGLTRADIDRKVREAAARLGVEGLLDRRPRELSGGERQRVAVGRAIVRSPQVFLFDEPLSNLDARLRLEMRSEIKRLVRSLSTTTLYVTHDQEEAMTLGDRVVVMKDGVVQQVGRPLDVYERPANRFVAGFVGMPPMNFVDGRLERDGAGLAFVDGRAAYRLPASKAALVAGRADRPVVLGIRPDGISPVQADRVVGSAGRFGVKVTQIEPLGDRKDVYMTSESGARLVGRVEARCELQEGQEVSMFIDMNRVHLFEPGETGVNLTAGSTEAVTTQDAGRVE